MLEKTDSKANSQAMPFSEVLADGRVISDVVCLTRPWVTPGTQLKPINRPLLVSNEEFERRLARIKPDRAENIRRAEQLAAEYDPTK